jgi:hypothetical protein
MKIKITQPGWAGYTGDLGAFAFVDGVSVEDVGRADAAFLAGIVSIEDVADGKNPSMSQRIIDNYGNEAVVEPVVAKAEPAAIAGMSKESLEAVADADGIKGLREISDPMGLKANSIHELIEKILAAQVDAALAAAQAAKDAAE